MARDGMAEPASRGQILRRKREFHVSCSADHEQGWQPYPVDPCSAISNDHAYIYIYRYLMVMEKKRQITRQPL